VDYFVNRDMRLNLAFSYLKKKFFFKDWNLLAASPEPPAGIHEFIEQAKEILSYKT